MVNPSSGSIAISPCLENSSYALKIKYGIGIECDIYSKSFTALLAKLNPILDLGKTYKLSGDIGLTNKLIIFNIKDITPVDSTNKIERRNQT